MTQATDLGDGHTIELCTWDPDLAVNPQLRAVADQFPVTATAILRHPLNDRCRSRHHLAEGVCMGAITFDLPLVRAHFPGPFWQVQDWDPLTLAPSLLCHCGDHGYVQAGRWVTVPG